MLKITLKSFQSNKSIITIFAFTLPMIFLQGCFPVVATGIVASAVAVTDRRTAGIIVEDETIELKFLGEKIRNYSANDGVSVAATSFNRTVLLTGWVPNDGIKEEIAKLAAQIENVREIVNEVNIGPPATSATYGKDAILTTKVKASLIDENKLNGIVVKVKTESAVVYLMGIVTEKEASLAADIASRIVGTKRVVRAFEVVSEDEIKKFKSPSN